MSDLLKSFNKAGLIDKLDGSDERFTKIETAADNVAEKLKESPPMIIRAILAGLDPDIPVEDPAIVLAADKLSEVWTSVRSVHTDPPLFIYRSILLDACNQVAEGVNAVMLSYTAFDALPLAQLGREEGVVRSMLTEWARKAEAISLVVPQVTEPKRAPSTKKIEPLSFNAATASKVNRETLLNTVAATVFPNYKGQAVDNPNPYQPNAHPQQWAGEFSDRMMALLADQIDSVKSTIAQSQNGLIKQLEQHETHQLEAVKELLSSQRSWLQEVVKQSEEFKKAEHLRLNTLWWCEALYSTSLCCSYRDIDPVLAASVMPFDFLSEVQTPTPASVTYALSEAVAKLVDADFSKSYKFEKLLGILVDKCSILEKNWVQKISASPEIGRLTIRDLIVAVLQGEKDTKLLMKRAGLDSGFTISLPRLAQAIYRQEQAVILAGAEK